MNRKEHYDIPITLEQRLNLEKLSSYLKGDIKARFNMSFFTNTLDENTSLNCGSSGCALGHGPYAGIYKKSEESWPDYADRCFTSGDRLLFEWLFSAYWDIVDNMPIGAAKRIDFFLDNGCPGESKICAMQDETLPLIY